MVQGVVYCGVGEVGVCPVKQLAEPTQTHVVLMCISEVLKVAYYALRGRTLYGREGDATPSDIRTGKTAVVKGELITGTMTGGAPVVYAVGTKYIPLDETVTGDGTITNANSYIRLDCTEAGSARLDAQNTINKSGYNYVKACMRAWSDSQTGVVMDLSASDGVNTVSELLYPVSTEDGTSLNEIWTDVTSLSDDITVSFSAYATSTDVPGIYTQINLWNISLST